jgi:hypothetical protein
MLSDHVWSAWWLCAYGRMKCCRSPRRYRAARRSCLKTVSNCASLLITIPRTFDPHVCERCAVRNELGFDALSFERVPSLCIWLRSAWTRDRTTDHGGCKSSCNEPHCKTRLQFLESEKRETRQTSASRAIAYGTWTLILQE